MFKTKKSQSQVITTVLLVLLSIAAIVIISAFIFPMVKENLGSGECFKAKDQLFIDTGSELTYFFKSGAADIPNSVYVSIERGNNRDINISGIIITIGNNANSDSYIIYQGDSYEESVIQMYGIPIGAYSIPNFGEKRTYQINTDYSDVKYIEIAPILSNGKKCEKIDRQEIETSMVNPNDR